VPHYQFFIPSDSNTARNKAAIAEAFTEVHTRVTGAPAFYVNCTFVEVPPGSVFVGGKTTPHGRMEGTMRRGRTEEVKRRLIAELADAWSRVGEEPLDKIALFLHEIPGYHAMENGEILREASEDHLLVKED
jgi:phenylpyruvate tautomerase PptA (4-oxalocrotonate tautomerase family)